MLARLDQRSQQHSVRRFVDALLGLGADLLKGDCLENEVLVLGSRTTEGRCAGEFSTR